LPWPGLGFPAGFLVKDYIGNSVAEADLAWEWSGIGTSGNSEGGDRSRRHSQTLKADQATGFDGWPWAPIILFTLNRKTKRSV